jgi:hypothetical protein
VFGKIDPPLGIKMHYLDTPQSCCLFGLARCDITPPVGIYHRIWGAATHDRATGIHRPLTATALVLRPRPEVSTEPEQVLVALDLCILWAKEMKALQEAVCRQTGLADGQLLVTFSHSHAAGLIGLERLPLPGGDLIPSYLDKLAAQVTALVQQARRALQPVVMTYGAGRCTLAANRDFWDENARQFVCGFNPAGPADDTVLVARVTDAGGEVKATLANYACHPTTLAWQNTLISPDFPGAMREVIEQATGAPCVFLQGASGDIGPREGYVGDLAVADRNGRQLGYAALTALEGLPPAGTRFQYTGPVVSGATLGTWAHVPLDSEASQRNGRWRLRRWTVDLPYRQELPTVEGARAEQARWQAEEQAALQAGDAARARDCRALAERMTRWLTRLATLPPGPTFPLSVTLWQMGAAIWVVVEGEHYNLLQRALRERFPGLAIVVITLANGARPTYLPTKDAYGKGLYQDSVAVLAPGCLESLIDGISEQIQAWQSKDVSD